MHMRIFASRAAALALFVPLAACGGRGGDMDLPAPTTTPLADAAATITAADMIDRIGVLAHDSMRGRNTPSPGLEMAARYIVREFRRMGLEGGAEGGEFIQRYPFPLLGLDTARTSLAITGLPALTYGADYLVYAGQAESIDAPVAVVGSATQFAESNPAAGSLAGRVTVAALAGPYGRDMAMAMDAARAAAEAAGAPATIFVLPADFPAAAYTQFRTSLGSPRRTLGGLTNRPMVLLPHDVGAELLGASGATTVALRSPVTSHADDTAPNVIAILRGSDPALADEYVVFSAHMDHVGVGRPDASGDSIYNGADDDASGTAALIEVAEAFSNLLERPARSLVFMAVSGEEKGLLGSRWWSEHPTLPLENVVANINVDMIGRNAPDTIVVIGQEYSSLGPTVHAVANARRADVGLNVAVDPWPEERFFFRSDHCNFARKEIPALFFFAGVHDDYHQPSDHVELIDGDKSARVARLVFYTAHEIADTAARPTWTDEGLSEIRALTSGGR